MAGGQEMGWRCEKKGEREGEEKADDGGGGSLCRMPPPPLPPPVLTGYLGSR